jgi:pimeloyl-ACP methyl ester carboxylesterase
MGSIVLVHGGWAGGWFWGRVRTALAAAGHNVYTPTLTGLGERKHLATPETSLDLHIQDVLGVLEYEDLHHAVLVGHSYGGMVISGVAEQAAHRLWHLVYLDALVPQDGESVADLLGPEVMAAIEQSAQQKGDGWRASLPFSLDKLGILSEVDIRWVSHRFTPHPLASVRQPIRLRDAAAVPRTFVYCTKPPLGLLETSAARAKAAGWRYKELATGHAAPVIAPKEVAALIQEVVP